MFIEVSIDDLIANFKQTQVYADKHGHGNASAVISKIVRDLETLKGLPDAAIQPEVPAPAPAQGRQPLATRLQAARQPSVGQGPAQWPGSSPLGTNVNTLQQFASNRRPLAEQLSQQRTSYDPAASER